MRRKLSWQEQNKSYETQDKLQIKLSKLHYKEFRAHLSRIGIYHVQFSSAFRSCHKWDMLFTYNQQFIK